MANLAYYYFWFCYWWRGIFFFISAKLLYVGLFLSSVFFVFNSCVLDHSLAILVISVCPTSTFQLFQMVLWPPHPSFQSIKQHLQSPSHDDMSSQLSFVYNSVGQQLFLHLYTFLFMFISPYSSLTHHAEPLCRLFPFLQLHD